MKAAFARTKPQTAAASPMTAAYAVAERLAADAVTEWAIEDAGAYDRCDHTELVREALRKTASVPDSLEHLQNEIERHVGDRTKQNEMINGSISLLVDATNAGYLYGLAVGLRLGHVRGGVR